MKLLERVSYLTAIAVLLFFALRAGDQNAPADDERTRELEERRPLSVMTTKIHAATLPGGASVPASGQTGKEAASTNAADTIRLPKSLAAELSLFLFERGTFILSRERLKLAGLSDEQIKDTESVYANAITRVQ